MNAVGLNRQGNIHPVIDDERTLIASANALDFCSQGDKVPRRLLFDAQLKEAYAPGTQMVGQSLE